MSIQETPLAASVIVPTRNRAQLLARFLPSLAKQEFDGEYEVIVVDNGSTDNTPLIVGEVSAQWPHVRLVTEPRPWPARARHAGAIAAKSSLLIFVDDDMLADRHFVSEHVRIHRENPSRVVLGNIVSVPAGHPFDRMLAYIYDGPKQALAEREPRAEDFWSGNVSLPRDLYFRMGGYSEALADLFCEDLEFGLRLARAGVKMTFAPTVLARHHFSERFPARLKRSYNVGIVWAHLKEQYPDMQAGFARDAESQWRARIIEWSCRAIALLIEPFARGEGMPPKLLAFVYDLGLRTAVGRGIADYTSGGSILSRNLKHAGRTSANAPNAAVAGSTRL